MSDPRVSSSEPNPRAFATATGFVFQIVGVVLALGGCVLWSASGQFQDPLKTPIESLPDYFARPVLPQTIAMIDTVVTFVAGLGLLAAGLGLQAEKRTGGRWALLVTVPLSVVWWASTVGMIMLGSGLGATLVAAFFSGVSTVLFLLAGNSARVLRQHPPDENLNVVTDEFLEQYQRRRYE